MANVAGPNDALTSALDFISRVAAGPAPVDVLPALDRVLSEVNSLLEVDGLGVMLLGEDLILRGAVASDERARLLALVQEHTGTGPSVDAFVENRPVTSIDLAEDDKWPDAADLVVCGVRSVLAVPIDLAIGPVGTLHAYTTTAGEWDPETLGRVQAWAAAIAELLRSAAQAKANEAAVSQLQYALDRRVLIEQAKGVLMERHQLSAESAFERLRTAARRARRPVLQVARETVESTRPRGTAGGSRSAREAAASESGMASEALSASGRGVTGGGGAAR